MSLVGRVLASRYRLEEHLGRGAMGDVYRARHVKVPRAFAVKVLLPDLVADPKVVARFEREAELAGRLRHKNVTSVVDVGETDGTRFLVMDFAEGKDLATLMASGPISTERAIALFRQIVEGLEHAHANDVVHRDLKPENVLVEAADGGDVARIVDFGVAILREGAADGAERLTTGGLVIGTPHYMAPELATGKPFDQRVDLFALGVILYELLAGVMPYDGDGVEVALQNLKVATPPMALRAPHVTVDPLHEGLVRKLMAKKPEDRVQTARDVRVLLELIASDRAAAAAALGVELPAPPAPAPAAVEPPPRDTRSTRELLRVATRRSRWIGWATLAALVLAATAIGVSLIGRHEASAAVTLEMDGDSMVGAAPVLATANEPAPPPAIAVVEPPLAPSVAPVVQTVARPAPRVVPPLEAPADAHTVVELYQTIARELKAIADRRDMTADDLWQRYRLIRIQDALTSSAKRAEVMNELAQIHRELERRFKRP